MIFQIIKCHLKTKLRNIRDRYNHIRVLYKFRKIVEKLSRNNSIMVLKQDKGRRVVVIDRKISIEKCLNLLNTDSFLQLDHDPTKAIEEKILRSIHKIKNNLTKQEYSRIYPTGSSPGKFYGTAKQHKFKKAALWTISLLDQLFAMLELHHINWLNTWQNSFIH